MKRNIMFTISLAALALTSCGKKANTVTENASVNATNASSTEAPATLSAAQLFANKAAASDAFEIESSKLAAANAASAKTKTFAQSMIKGHTESTAKLKAAAAEAMPAIVPDAALSSDQQEALDDLRGKTGADFDAAYAEAQIKAHQMTLDALKAYATSGDAPSLKAFAASMVPIVTAHVNMATSLKP